MSKSTLPKMVTQFEMPLFFNKIKKYEILSNSKGLLIYI